MAVKIPPLLLLTAVLLMTQSVSVDAQTTASGAQQSAEPIRYTVSFPQPHTHYVEVSATVPTGGRADDRADDGGVDAGLVPGP